MYFSNSDMGEAFQEKQCYRCKHWRLRNKDDEYPNCPIWDIHIIYNYDQMDKDKKDLREAMNILIDEDKWECSMFEEKEPIDLKEE